MFLASLAWIFSREQIIKDWSMPLLFSCNSPVSRDEAKTVGTVDVSVKIFSAIYT